MNQQAEQDYWKAQLDAIRGKEGMHWLRAQIIVHRNRALGYQRMLPSSCTRLLAANRNLFERTIRVHGFEPAVSVTVAPARPVVLRKLPRRIRRATTSVPDNG